MKRCIIEKSTGNICVIHEIEYPEDYDFKPEPNQEIKILDNFSSVNNIELTDLVDNYRFDFSLGDFVLKN